MNHVTYYYRSDSFRKRLVCRNISQSQAENEFLTVNWTLIIGIETILKNF